MIDLKPESGRGGVSFQFLELRCGRLTASAIPGCLPANPGIRLMHTNTWGVGSVALRCNCWTFGWLS